MNLVQSRFGVLILQLQFCAWKGSLSQGFGLVESSHALHSSCDVFKRRNDHGILTTGGPGPQIFCVTPFLLWSTLLGWWLCSLGSKFRYNSFYGDTNMAKVFERGEKIACAIKWSWDGKSPVSQATPCSVSLPVKWRSLLDCDAVTVTSSGVRCHTLVPVLGAWPGGGKIINTQGTHIFWQQYNITY